MSRLNASVQALGAAPSAASATAEVNSSPVITLMGSLPVRDGSLASEAVTGNLAPGNYLLRLTVGLIGGRTLAPCEIRFHRSVS